MKPLIELSAEQYNALLKEAAEISPLYSKLKNAVKTEANTINVLCEVDEADMLRHMAKRFYPDAIPQIEKAIRVAHSLDRRFPSSFSPNLSVE
jgi:hypothetical protein